MATGILKVQCSVYITARVMLVVFVPATSGYYVHVRCLDVGDDLLDMKLYAPDYTQAKYLGNSFS